MEKTQGCLICEKPLIYLDKKETLKCSFCHENFESMAMCEDGHYVCDDCHGKKGIEYIIEFCENSDSKNPIEILDEIMKNPYIYMHGPEHHVMVGASLLTAYKNAGGEIDLKESLLDMKSRGEEYPGGSCGFWGCCGAAVSLGMFLSIITKSTPLSKESWGLINQGTGKALKNIGELGGPRCCKRNSFTAVKTGVEFVKENFNIYMELPEKVSCNFYKYNNECLTKGCPYFGSKLK